MWGPLQRHNLGSSERKAFNLLFLIFFGTNFFWNTSFGLTPNLAAKLNRLASTSEARVGITFVDLKTGQKISINGSQPFPTASVIKVAVALAAFHFSDSGKLDLNQRVLFQESDKLGGAGVLRWMKAGREYSLWNLLRLMITLSDNTATRLAINAIGLENINAYIQQMGLKITIIKDSTMLVEPPDSHTNFSTPDEMAQILWMIYHHRGLSQKSSKQLIAWMNYQRYRWGIWRGLPPGTYVANKTGHLEGITNDAGIICTKKGNYILSIFTWGFKKTRTARRLINEISRVVYEDYTGEKVVRPKINAKRKLRLRSPKTPKHRLEPS